MKKNFKLTLAIFSILIITTVFLITIKAGELTHTVYSPYDTVSQTQTAEYDSGLTAAPTTTSVIARYKDSIVYEDHIADPYCKIGGMYTVNVYSDYGLGTSNNDYNAYYCKTIEDLINLIKIPNSWALDDLLVYCNDGSNINSKSNNFDELMTQMNIYKACVVKNLDLKENNSILYGFEVGNKIVDSDSAYFYDNNTNIGPIITEEFDSVEIFSESTTIVEEPLTSISIDYIEQTIYCKEGSEVETNWDGNPVDFSCNECIVGVTTNTPENDCQDSGKVRYAQPTLDYVLDYAIDAIPESDVSSVSLYLSFDDENYAIYNVFANVEYSANEYLYNFSDRFFYFKYDSNQKFFTLKEFDSELTYSILNIFTLPSDLELSRIAILKQSNNNKYIGYEQIAKDVSSDDSYSSSIKPIYKILMDSIDGFDSDVCINVLSNFEASENVLATSDEVVCNSNSISIISQNLNTDSKSETAFRLFKNIILALGSETSGENTNPN